MAINRNAFSLVELSIVLVILGLLVGGVLSGQSLIHAAELRSLTQEHSKYVAALNSFKEKYFALPGDMTNATKFWGAAGPPASCWYTVGTGTQTCDGTGDGQIFGFGNTYGGYEELRAWQQLANAGLIEGKFDAADDFVATNYPASRFPTIRWLLFYQGPVVANSNTSAFGGDYGNVLYTFSNSFSGPTFPSSDGWNVDKKIDDGKPGTGSVVVIDKSCTTNAGMTSDSGAEYKLLDQAATCGLQFKKVI